MLAIKNNRINHLNLISSKAINDDKHWIDIRKVNESRNLTEEYRSICTEFHTSNKWVLMVNPENETLDELAAKSDISRSKVLRVHSTKVKVSIQNIETALRKGNCSVVVLCNAHFSESELLTLSASAKKGNTPCIILKNKHTIH
jgi:cell division inhibitor SulA